MEKNKKLTKKVKDFKNILTFLHTKQFKLKKYFKSSLYTLWLSIFFFHQMRIFFFKTVHFHFNE